MSATPGPSPRIEKSKLRDPQAHGFGTWRIVDARTGRVVAGDRRTGYGLTLAQVAERLGYSDS